MPAYAILSRERVRDADRLAEYSKQVPGSLEGHDAIPRAVFGRMKVLEGPDIDGIAIIEFPTLEQAQAWYDSEIYQRAALDRFLAADFRCVIVEGLNGHQPAPSRSQNIP